MHSGRAHRGKEDAYLPYNMGTVDDYNTQDLQYYKDNLLHKNFYNAFGDHFDDDKPS
eukprot:CAMPEP_0119131600 /NCGR_PEP_ID=MMETSP1310-20130426/10476_1 /TAXON_ID=464262 /ORGANISM="Genus nov. species nov., Strain RCC2339" /LENGTH=56 /DNA_ID=CAMNT_0007122185 /DNA_START=308 /DNA_END=478 /DNA_ORIENTATION=-